MLKALTSKGKKKKYVLVHDLLLEPGAQHVCDPKKYVTQKEHTTKLYFTNSENRPAQAERRLEEKGSRKPHPFSLLTSMQSGKLLWDT